MENLERVVPRAREEKLVVRELPDELLVYDLERHRAHSLNRAAALVWRHCDGRTSVAEIAALLSREMKLPADERLVWMALARLQRAHLLRERVTAPGDGTNHSRRAMIRKLGLAGGLALLLPLVESIVAPEAAWAGTVLAGGCCSSSKDCAGNLTCNCSSTCGSNCPSCAGGNRNLCCG